jgi:hypothetical protein
MLYDVMQRIGVISIEAYQSDGALIPRIIYYNIGLHVRRGPEV